MNCERFEDTLAAGEDASPRELEEAREHAAVCGECRQLGEAFVVFEEERADVPPAPAAFASRVMARLPLGPESRAEAAAPRVQSSRPWIFSGAVAAAGAALAALGGYFAYTGTGDLGVAVDTSAFTSAFSAASFGPIMGASVAAAVVAGFFAYYYLFSTD